MRINSRSKQFLSYLAFGTALFVCTVPSMAAPATNSASLDKVLWDGANTLFSNNLVIASSLLLREGRDDVTKAAHQLHIQWNAASIVRVSKAYAFYEKGMRTHFSKHLVNKRLKPLRQNISALVKAASALRKDALAGTRRKGWARPFQRILAYASGTILGPRPKKKLTTKQRSFLKEVIAGLGTGGEMLAFFRLRQLVADSQKAPANKAARKELLLFYRMVVRHMRLFRSLRKSLPKAKWLPLFSYHAVLLVRATARFGASLKKGTPKRKKTLLAAYAKYKGMLEKSLRQSNSSFKHIWRPAPGQ
jgi:hypothetical protein